MASWAMDIAWTQSLIVMYDSQLAKAEINIYSYVLNWTHNGYTTDWVNRSIFYFESKGPAIYGCFLVAESARQFMSIDTAAV